LSYVGGIHPALSAKIIPKPILAHKVIDKLSGRTDFGQQH